MPSLPVLPARNVVKIFERFDWKVARSKGSHIIMIKEGQIASLSIPNHKEVAKGTLRRIIYHSDISETEFMEASKKV